MSGGRLTPAPITPWLWGGPAGGTFPRLGWPEAVARCPGGGPLAGSSFPTPGPWPSSSRGAQDVGSHNLDGASVWTTSTPCPPTTLGVYS